MKYCSGCQRDLPETSTRNGIVVKDGKMVAENTEFLVRVMAVSENYAMVRRKRAMPFVCSIVTLRLAGEGNSPQLHQQPTKSHHGVNSEVL
jgi:hypothetical protein